MRSLAATINAYIHEVGYFRVHYDVDVMRCDAM